MKGQILEFSVQTSQGVISGADGSRYPFTGSEWKGDTPPTRGMSVDFDVQGSNAVAVYKALGSAGSSGTPGSKNRQVAGLLAIFLGGIGIHKFYLGYTKQGLVYLLANTIGCVVTMFLLWIPNIALYCMAVIEGIIYLTKSDEEFEQTYVVGKKPWF
jgi:TM2 domain-containing membrane protein YozV